MKKTLVTAILGLAAAASIQAQGFISLYNYNAGGILNPITYGANSGGTLNANVTSPGYTVGMYYFVGSSAATVNAAFNGSGFDIPTGMTFATGVGATTGLGTDAAGQYASGASYGGFPPGTQTADFAVTIVVVAFQTSVGNYAGSTIRGHSQAFQMTAKTFDAPTTTGSLMNGFQIIGVPEPSTFALAGLGLAGLLIFRRRK